LDIKKDLFHNEGGEALALVAQRSCGCPILGSVEGQVGQGFGQFDLVKNVPALGMGVGLNDLQRSLPTQTIL